MNTSTKIWTLFKGKTRQVNQSIIDQHAMTILDQELHDAEQSLKRSKNDLAKLMAQRIQWEKNIESKQAQVREYESKLKECLEKDNETLSTEIAEHIDELDQELNVLHKDLGFFQQKEKQFKKLIADYQRKIRGMRQQQSVAQVKHSLQQSSASCGSSRESLANQIERSQDSLSRINERFDNAMYEQQARDELEQEAGSHKLDQKLAANGIGSASKEQRLKEIMQRVK